MPDYYDDSYESPAALEARIAREIAKRRERGEPFTAVPSGVARGMPASSFWGKAWCENLESYSEYEHRLPRGRSYLRKGQVFDLEVSAGHLFAYVTGREIYEVEVSIAPLRRERWEELKLALAGEVSNLVELLSGRLGDGVLAAVTDREAGLFPSPQQIQFGCSCPDHADLCKHAAAVMYAVGVALDERPELLFKLRDVDPAELADAARAGGDLRSGHASAGILRADELAELFDIDLAEPETAFGAADSFGLRPSARPADRSGPGRSFAG